MGRVVHFEIASDNPEKLTSFYKSIFNWSFQKWGDTDYWLATTGDDKEMGINGAITKRNSNVPTTVNTIDVKNLGEAMTAIAKQGGQVLTEIMDIPDVGKFIYCKDPDGNIIGVIESKRPM